KSGKSGITKVESYSCCKNIDKLSQLYDSFTKFYRLFAQVFIHYAVLGEEGLRYMQNYVLSLVIISVVVLGGCQTVPMTSLTNHLQSAVIIEAQSRPHLINFWKIKKTEQRPIIALVLGSGGARGCAPIGAVEAREAAGLRPDCIVVTIAGRRGGP